VNGGDSWSAPTTVNEDLTGGDDKESITADPFHSSNIYATWDRFLSPPSLSAHDQGRFHAQSFAQQAYFSRTTNAGASWSKPTILYNPGSRAGTIGNIITVLPGDVLVDGFIVFANNKQPIHGASIAIVRSFNQGLKWQNKATIVSRLDPTDQGTFDPDNPSLAVRSGGLPDFAVNPTTGTLYAVWQDDSLTPGTDAIIFSQSTNGGSTWSTPIKINQTPTNIPAADQQAFTPTIKVAADGTVGVTYYDFRNNTPAPGLLTDYWLVACHGSCTNASSWAGHETHVGGSFDEEQAAYAGGFFVGDYEGLVPAGGGFGAYFGMAVNRATDPSDIFYSQISPAP
jgi:hypothetical protein